MAEHNTLTGSNLHEPKYIDSAGTSDAGKIVTPSSSSAGTGELRELLVTELDTGAAAEFSLYESDGSGNLRVQTVDDVYLMGRMDDVSTAGQTIYIPCPFAGDITNIRSVIDGAIATSDVILTCSINTTAITGGAITITQTSSAAGDVDSVTPTAANTVAAGDYLRVTTDNASTNTVAATVIFTINRAA